MARFYIFARRNEHNHPMIIRHPKCKTMNKHSICCNTLDRRATRSCWRKATMRRSSVQPNMVDHFPSLVTMHALCTRSSCKYAIHYSCTIIPGLPWYHVSHNPIMMII